MSVREGEDPVHFFFFFFSCGLQMGFVISQCSLMDDCSLPVIRIKYKEGHK